MSDHEDYEGLAAGYALHALEPEDEQRLAAHLLTCNSCARLVADTAELGASFAEFLPPEPPPSALRARILAAAAAEPRVPGSQPLAKPSAALLPDPPTAGIPEPVAVTGDAAPGRPEHSRVRRLALRSRVAVGALAAVVAVAVAVPVTLAVSDSGKSSGTNSALEQLLLAPGARTVTLTASGGAANTAVAKAVVANQGIYLVADGLPANNADKSVYVLWAANAQGVPSPVATFDVHGTSPVALKTTDVPVKASDISGVAVSIEPGRTAPAKPTDVVLSGMTV
jgi:hypothetical protein